MAGAPTRVVVVIDGSCVFCSRLARFAANRDKADHLRFVASESAEGMHFLRSCHLVPDQVASLVVVDGEEILLASEAALHIVRHLCLPWRLLSALRAVPLPVREWFYYLIASIRHRLAGRQTSCLLPEPALQTRRLDIGKTSFTPKE